MRRGRARGRQKADGESGRDRDGDTEPRRNLKNLATQGKKKYVR